MNKIEKALSRFDGSYSCSESILSSYAPLFGLEEGAALKIASGFGGGMARRGETCGAVTGAVMALGLKFGRERADDKETKERTYELVNRFTERFLSEKGSLVCRNLVGVDISTPEGLAEILASRAHHENCREIVRTACRILEDLLEE